MARPLYNVGDIVYFERKDEPLRNVPFRVVGIQEAPLSFLGPFGHRQRLTVEAVDAHYSEFNSTYSGSEFK
jgi:hypothetical protein